MHPEIEIIFVLLKMRHGHFRNLEEKKETLYGPEEAGPEFVRKCYETLIGNEFLPNNDSRKFSLSCLLKKPIAAYEYTWMDKILPKERGRPVIKVLCPASEQTNRFLLAPKNPPRPVSHSRSPEMF